MSAKKVRRWNQLMPEVGGQPMPPRAKMNEQWRQKVMGASIARAAPTEAEMEARRATDALLWNIVATKISQIGRDETALQFMQIAEVLAVPGRGGRPRGSGAYNLHETAALTRAVLELSDGSPSGMRKAISTVVNSKPLHQRAGLRVMLKREVQRLHPRITDKTRT